MAKSQKQQPLPETTVEPGYPKLAPDSEYHQAKEETITVSKDKLYRLAYRIVVAGGVRLTPYEAQRLAVEVLGVPWDEIKQYITDHPR